MIYEQLHPIMATKDFHPTMESETSNADVIIVDKEEKGKNLRIKRKTQLTTHMRQKKSIRILMFIKNFTDLAAA